MSAAILFIDTDVGEPVVSLTDMSPGNLPLFFQDDSLDLKIYLLHRIDGEPVPIPTTGVTLQVSFGEKGESEAIWASQPDWTPSSDLSDPYFSAVFPLNTSQVATALGDATKTRGYFEVKYTIGGLPVTALSKRVNLYAALIKADTLVVPAGQTPLSAEVARGTFLQDVINRPITLVCPTDSTKKGLIYWGEDNSFHADPIT